MCLLFAAFVCLFVFYSCLKPAAKQPTEAVKLEPNSSVEPRADPGSGDNSPVSVFILLLQALLLCDFFLTKKTMNNRPTNNWLL